MLLLKFHWEKQKNPNFAWNKKMGPRQSLAVTIAREWPPSRALLGRYKNIFFCGGKKRGFLGVNPQNIYIQNFTPPCTRTSNLNSIDRIYIHRSLIYIAVVASKRYIKLKSLPQHFKRCTPSRLFLNLSSLISAVFDSTPDASALCLTGFSLSNNVNKL